MVVVQANLETTLNSDEGSEGQRLQHLASEFKAEYAPIIKADFESIDCYPSLEKFSADCQKFHISTIVSLEKSAKKILDEYSTVAKDISLEKEIILFNRLASLLKKPLIENNKATFHALKNKANKAIESKFKQMKISQLNQLSIESLLILLTWLHRNDTKPLLEIIGAHCIRILYPCLSTQQEKWQYWCLLNKMPVIH